MAVLALSPHLTRLSLLVQRNLTEYFVAVDVNNMLRLFASMLHERRIIVTSGKLSTVSTARPTPMLCACSAGAICIPS